MHVCSRFIMQNICNKLYSRSGFSQPNLEKIELNLSECRFSFVFLFDGNQVSFSNLPYVLVTSLYLI